MEKITLGRLVELGGYPENIPRLWNLNGKKFFVL